MKYLMDQKKEQAKVREKILKVFRARAQSPGGGPAIVVNAERHQSRRKGAHTNIKSDEFPKHKLHDSDDFLLSDGNATPVDAMEKGKSRKDKHLSATEKTQRLLSKQESQVKNHNPGLSSRHKKSQQRERKRKSRAERNKHRAQKQQQVNPHEREEFRKHVKKAREITSQSKLNDSQSDDQVFVAITQNRLTRQAGIYNKGKKSSRLFRDPLHVSERVTADVEKDLRTIVESRNSRDVQRVSSIESLPIETGTPTMPDRKASSTSTGCTKSLRRNRVSDSGTARESHPNSAKCRSSVEQTTQVLDMQDLSSQLMASLDVRQLFPCRDYAAEVKSELMKSNCSGKEEVLSAQTVRRSLQSSSPKDTTENKSSLHLTDQSKIFKKTPMSCLARARLPHATACVQPESNSVHHSQDEVILMEVPKAPESNQPNTKHMDNNHNSQADSTLSDAAVQLLKLADGTCLQIKTLQRNDMTLCASTHPKDNGQTNDWPHDSYSSELSSSQSFYVRNAVDQFRCDSVRLKKPSYGDGCEDALLDSVRSRRYKLDGGHSTGYSRYSLLQNEGLSTDILDHIGIEQMEVAGPSPSLPDPFEYGYNTTETDRLSDRHHRRLTQPLQHPQPHTITQFKKCDSDSESSPVWYPTFSISPILKPKLESPSPPEFYPQRMF